MSFVAALGSFLTMAGELKTTSYDDLCRLCASKVNLRGIHIFEKVGVIRGIERKITSCLTIQIHMSDNLPKWVCLECVYKLEELYGFREKCLATETFLTGLTKVEGKADHNNMSISIDNTTISPIDSQLDNPVLNALPHEPHCLSLDAEAEPLSSHPLHSVIQQSPDSSSELHSQNLDVHLTLPQSELMTDDDLGITNADDIVELARGQGIDMSEMDINQTIVLNEQNLDLIRDPNLQDQFSIIQELHHERSETLIMKSNKLALDIKKDPSLQKDNESASEHSDIESEFITDDMQPYEDISNRFYDKNFPPILDERLNKDISHFESEGDEDDVEPMNLMDEDLDDFDDETEPENKSDLMQGIQDTKKRKWEPKVCKECGKSYRTNYKLTEHMRKHTGEKPYKCSVCDKAFRSKIGLAQHEAKHTGQYDYSCTTCGKGFQCKSYLIVHQRVHSDLKPYPCTSCNRNFKTKQSMLDHMNRHLGVKPYSCETCGRGFITKGLCKSHQRVHSGTDNRQFPCNVCEKMFVSKSYLATHLRIHTGEKPFMCEVCGKGFLTRVDLRIHSTMHTGEKSFVCEMCGKAFARRDALRCHRRSHTGERPYRCDVCGQSFTQFSPMAIHKRLHTGERPYPCDMCAKTFVSRSTMMSHRKKHDPPSDAQVSAPAT